MTKSTKTGQGVCGFHWGCVFCYLRYASLVCPCSEKFSSVKSVLNSLGWWDYKPPTWGPEINSQRAGPCSPHFFSQTFHRESVFCLPDCLLFLFWTFCSGKNEEMKQQCVLSKVSWKFMAQSQSGHGTAESPSLSFLGLCFSSAFSENVLQTLGFPSLLLKNVLVP